MKTALTGAIFFICFTQVAAFCQQRAAGEDADIGPCFKTTSIPGFPKPENKLLEIRDGQEGAMRAHAWSIFSAIAQAKHGPMWEDWDTKCDVGISECKVTPPNISVNKALRGLEFPVQLIEQYKAPSGLNFAFGLDFNFGNLIKDMKAQPELASVRFNPEAACHILKTRISDADHLHDLLKGYLANGAPASEREVPPFPAAAIAVKTEWEVIQTSFSADGKSTKKVLHVYDPSTSQISDAGDGGSYQSLPYSSQGLIEVDMTPGIGCRDKDYGAKVPLSCFYVIYVKTQAELDAIDPLAGLLIQNTLPPPFYVALVGLHIATKEIPEWEWETFYWSNRAFDINIPQNAGRPDSVMGLWRHFEMDTTLSSETPPDPASHGPRICANPYLEGHFDHGASSNCLFCHRFASYVDNPASRTSPIKLGAPSYKGGRRIEDANVESAFLKDSLSTDFLWSLGDIQAKDSEKLLQEFQLYLFDISLDAKAAARHAATLNQGTKSAASKPQ